MHPSTEALLTFFEYDHLPEPLRTASQPFCDLAHDLVDELPENAETTVCLRKLLESKDCAVRSVILATRTTER